MAKAARRNESALSYAWLSESIGQPAQSHWDRICGQMRSVDQPVVYTQDWVSDFWLARNSKSNLDLDMLMPGWDPPERVNEWPQLGVEALRGSLGVRTNHAAFVGLLDQNAVSVVSDHDEALKVFEQRESEIRQHADVRMIQGEHVRAWIGTALGRLLMGIALTPQDSTAPDSTALVQLTLERLVVPLQFELPVARLNAFEEWRLDRLYNYRTSPDSTLMVASDVRMGQGEEWREYWQWLSVDIGVAEALDALEVAARLMRCVPLVAAILFALQSEQEYLRTIALAVSRRWLLTLKVMAWLETALQEPWSFVRPQDLECFAFNAVKPEWPRRFLGISHRSADVKATLIKMKVWQNSRCGIDANYVPAWETNTGMMWGLFAAAPAIARVSSPRYLDSVWCRRELEITQYLLERSDYLAERWVLDLEQPHLTVLDDLLARDNEQPGLIGFPPQCQVWAPTPMPEWEVKMLRAAGALRIINKFLGQADLANRLAIILADGLEPPFSAPTNNPNGWRDYVKIFAELRALTSDESQLPLRLPIDYGEPERRADTELAMRIPDLSRGTPSLFDILVAFEWYRVEWVAMMEQGIGDLCVIDCQRLALEDWSAHEQVCLLRGLAAIRTTMPLWFLQLAGQEVENWPAVGERPIFTEHVTGQFSWMTKICLERGEAQALYPSASGLEFSKKLASLCRNQGRSRRKPTIGKS